MVVINMERSPPLAVISIELAASLLASSPSRLALATLAASHEESQPQRLKALRKNSAGAGGADRLPLHRRLPGRNQRKLPMRTETVLVPVAAGLLRSFCTMPPQAMVARCSPTLINEQASRLLSHDCPNSNANFKYVSKMQEAAELVPIKAFFTDVQGLSIQAVWALKRPVQSQEIPTMSLLIY